MNLLRKLGLMLPLAAALAVTGSAAAQATETISVIGSAVVNTLIKDMAQAAGISVEVTTTGTAAGIDRFCNGAIDLATASRQMTPAEATICAANDVAHSEFALGHNILAFAAGPDAPLACLSVEQIDSSLKPSASNSPTDWSTLGQASDLPLTLILPADDKIEYAILDSMVVGDGLRQDVVTYADSAEAIALVGETAGAIAILPWEDARDSDVNLLDVSGEAGACSAPTAAAVESGDYPAAHTLYVYVNRARLEARPGLAELMQFLFDAANAPLIAAAGITAPSSDALAVNAALFADAEALAEMGASHSAYEAPANLSGSIAIAGAANSHTLLEPIAELLRANNTELEINFEYGGVAASLARLCSAETDIAALDANLKADMPADCGDSDIATLSLPLGAMATVLLRNAGDDFASCLTTAQINRLWRAGADETPQDWSQVDPSFPVANITLFGLSSLGVETDILLQTADTIIPPIRRDTEQDFDPLYRAAAVANVPGALTYMTWQDYQRVRDNDQANIELVAIDGGDGCIAPTADAIAAGGYPLSRGASLLAHEQSLADLNVQSFLWALFNDANWSRVSNQGFIGVSLAELPAIRRSLRAAFSDAEAMFSPAVESDEAAAADEAADATRDEEASG